MASVEARPTPKKRRVSKTEDDDDGKKRGRPRVEKSDESAADRRRTQIRMAQRAYRQRKESTLEELRKRVNELNGIVESMETVFQDCMDRLVSSGLPENAVNELRMTAQRLAGLKTAQRELDMSDHDIIEREPAKSEDTLTPKNVSIWLDQTELTRPSRRPRVDDYLGLGYSIVLPENAEEPSYYSFRPQVNASIDHLLPNLVKQRPTPVIKELQPPRTYSFQETTFGRRIHRACLEAGYSLLLDPSRNLQTFERVFRLPLLARSRAELVACTRDVLDRSTTETLDLYEAPLIHIGGAGTHFPRRDKNGNMQQCKSVYSLGLVGPQTLKLLMQADEQRLTADMAVEIAGFEGEWFDPYDVEGYLASKGIVIESSASFAEVDPGAGVRALGDSASLSSRPGTPGLSNSSGSWKSLDNFDMASIPWNQFGDVPIANTGFGALNGQWQPEKAPEVSNNQPKPKNIMLDVQNFIRGLMTSAVCLGQTPGFKRKDVDLALSHACFAY